MVDNAQMQAKDVIDYFGSAASTARAVGVTRAAVHYWVKKDRVPELRAFQIERITNGELKHEPEATQ